MRTALALITMLCVAACGGASGGTGTNAKAASDQGLKFANCMRSHGVPNFPDPSAGGGIAITPGSGLNPQSPAFQAAQKRCGKLLPGGGPGARKPTRAQFVAGLAFARCMRAHGLPHFPDPLASAPAGSGPIISLRGMMFKPGPGLDPRSPAFAEAASHCGIRVPPPPT
ncbi:MAG TPA: hypothetical protein VHW96_16090 [Solirubrobacteraceae bacterium]|jgi:hypothetical protein|nr:hypothetical protein [Solirubrobacteraceae bacterium]